MVESHTIYNGLIVEQTSYSLSHILPKIFSEISPKNILEIGTAIGGLTTFISDICPESNILTIEKLKFYKYNFKSNVESVVGDVFSDKLVNDKIIPFIQQDGTTVVICDGGNKVKEFLTFGKYLKENDYIFAHDYCESKKHFYDNVYGKIWNYCRIVEDDIKDFCEKNELHTRFDYSKDGMWVVKKKLNNIFSKQYKNKIF